MRKPQIPLATK